jgi:PHD/YefM family antitoxin component YafN of YafNO toxin-antitoxin module
MAIEKTLSVTSARSQLLKLTKLAARHMTRFVLTNKGEAEAVLLSVSEYKSLRAAAELATHPEVLVATLRGFEEIERGKGLTLEQAFASEERVPDTRAASAGE